MRYIRLVTNRRVNAYEIGQCEQCEICEDNRRSSQERMRQCEDREEIADHADRDDHRADVGIRETIEKVHTGRGSGCGRVREVRGENRGQAGLQART